MSEDLKAQALEHIRKNIEASFATIWEGKPVIRILSTVKVEDDFTVYFTTGKSDKKMRHIEANPNVCLLYFAGKTDIRIFGKVETVDDPDLKKDLWDDAWKAYYEKGIDDPDYGIIRIKPESVELRNEQTGMNGKQLL